MKNDIIINKLETIKCCLNRIKEEYLGFEKELENIEHTSLVISLIL